MILGAAILASFPPKTIVAAFLTPLTYGYFSTTSFLTGGPITSEAVSAPSITRSVFSKSHSTRALVGFPFASGPPSLASAIPSGQP